MSNCGSNCKCKPKEKDKIEDIKFMIRKLQIGSYTCCTKTPEDYYHKEWCMYRRIKEVLDEIEKY